jgi:hypothetical protein
MLKKTSLNLVFFPIALLIKTLQQIAKNDKNNLVVCV